jgi:hypothetical protein
MLLGAAGLVGGLIGAVKPSRVSVGAAMNAGGRNGLWHVFLRLWQDGRRPTRRLLPASRIEEGVDDAHKLAAAAEVEAGGK